MLKIKQLISMILIATMLTGCGTPLDYNGKEYPTVGFINRETQKSEKMCYEVSVGNVIWSIILVETIVAPIYFVGWSLWNPVGPKGEKGCGIDAT